MRLKTSISEKRYVALTADADRNIETDLLSKSTDVLWETRVSRLGGSMLLSHLISFVICY